MANTWIKRDLSVSETVYKYTWSAWIKRGSLGVAGDLFKTRIDSNNWVQAYLHADNSMVLQSYKNGGYHYDFKTTQKFMDTNSWYHFVFNVDSSQSTAGDRVRIYVNGERITAFSTSNNNLTNGDSLIINGSDSGQAHTIGSWNNGSYFEGCMSHVHYSSGYSYAPTVFGSTDSTTGEWKINTSPTFTLGGNGYTVLKDGNTITDQSSNSNDFTVGGGTLTNTEDCPSDSFATLLSEYPSDPTGGFANANTTAKSNADSTWRSAFSSIATPPSGGKYYCELKWSSGSHLIWGAVSSTTICNNNFKDLTDVYTGNYMGLYGANWYNKNSSQGTYQSGIQLTSGNIGMMAMDRDNHKFWWGLNGSWGGSNNPATNTGGQSLTGDLDDFWHFAISVYSNSGAGAYEFNFGNGYFGTTAISSEGTNASGIGKFEYDVPSGFTALSTKGLNE